MIHRYVNDPYGRMRTSYNPSDPEKIVSPYEGLLNELYGIRKRLQHKKLNAPSLHMMRKAQNQLEGLADAIDIVEKWDDEWRRSPRFVTHT